MEISIIVANVTIFARIITHGNKENEDFVNFDSNIN